ncbi:hypothetical protein ACHDRE_000923 [Clostridioides difficile]
MDILLVEDDKNIREMVYDFLISENYSVKTALMEIQLLKYLKIIHLILFYWT